jgi:hypothetical protein
MLLLRLLSCARGTDALQLLKTALLPDLFPAVIIFFATRTTRFIECFTQLTSGNNYKLEPLVSITSASWLATYLPSTSPLYQ